MEQITLPDNHTPLTFLPNQPKSGSSENESSMTSNSKPFIEANTIPSTLEEIKNNHIIPVFIKDNETLISQAEFIDITMDCVSSVYGPEPILGPSIRLSHPIKGRVPSAREKPANQLQDHEKTLYYERMAFVIEIPSIQTIIDGHTLSLTVGGVKAYNLDNLYNKKGTEEHFKVFIGFQNKVCTNLCVWTDGLLGDLRVKNSSQLCAAITALISSYNAPFQIYHMEQLSMYSLTEQQFALVLGKCRLYPFLPKDQRHGISPIMLGDAQIKSIAHGYYEDEPCCRRKNGDLTLWRLYNLLTSANKSTYIDSFIERSVSAFNFTDDLKYALANQKSSWFIN